VLRYEPSSTAPSDWQGRPIPELGGIVLDFVDGALRLTRPNGLKAGSFTELAASEIRRADEAEARAVQAERRATELAERLRSLGHDTDS